MQFSKILLLTCFIFNTTFAADIKLVGTVDYEIKSHNLLQIPSLKKIKLLQFKLSKKAVAAVEQKAQLTHVSSNLMGDQGKEKQLGMNGYRF